jgi:hypothetical protein
MKLEEMLMLGDPRLHEISVETREDEVAQVRRWASGLDEMCFILIPGW